jgi:endo-1,4-beta-xylanase
VSRAPRQRFAGVDYDSVVVSRPRCVNGLRRRALSAKRGLIAGAVVLASCSGSNTQSAPVTTPAPTDSVARREQQPDTTALLPASIPLSPDTTQPSTSTTTDVSVATLRAHADRRNLSIGAAVAIEPLDTEPDYREVLAREFNMVVAEDVMKWDVLRPDRDTFDFAAADRIVEFAEENGMKIRGHTLVWFNALPPWLDQLELTRDEAIELLREHITTVVGRYRGRVAQWDVVNEPLNEGDEGGLRDNVWLRWIGDDYIDLAFQFAHEADPDAELYYNDYDWGAPGPKTDKIIDLARQLTNSGVPIDGVGIQFHVLSGIDVPAIRVKLAEIEALDLDVAMTEVDNGISLPVDPSKLNEQAANFAGLLETCLEQPRCDTFVMWGFTDRHSWIPETLPGYGAALIFDEQMQPKPAYVALADVLD